MRERERKKRMSGKSKSKIDEERKFHGIKWKEMKSERK
jgi:hypothetical protein